MRAGSEMGSGHSRDGALTPCRNDGADGTLDSTKGVPVSAAVPQVAPDAVDASVVDVRLEIDVHGRWDALALSELLIPFHVQQGLDR